MNKEAADVLSEMALLYELEEDTFRARAYERAAQAVAGLSEDIKDVYEKEGTKGLDGIPSVGEGIAKKLAEYAKTGRIAEHGELKKRLPVDILGLTAIEGVGPKMVRDLYKELGIITVRDLKEAAEKGEVGKLKGFGRTTEQNILQGIAFLERSGGRRLLGEMDEFASLLIERLEQSGTVKRAVAAGSLRRMKETVGDVDILATSEDPKKAIAAFLGLVKTEKVLDRGETKASVRLSAGFDADLRVLTPGVFASALQYFTGSKAHNVHFRTLAKERGYKVTEYGVFKGKKLLKTETEEDVYKLLGMPYIPPEMREDAGEIEAALEGTLPRPVGYGELKGDLQVQTDWTDGKDSIEQMAKEAERLGLEYIAVTDHTRDLSVALGADEKKLRRQAEEISRVQKRVSGVRILKGAEVNIRKDGTLDVADEALAELDVVGVAVHSHFKMGKKAMTERIIRALNNPHVNVLFHPTGRLLGRREAYEIDFDKIVNAAVVNNVLLEVNSAPERLDLSGDMIRRASALGATFAVNSDAHRTEQFGNLKYGVGQARRGWLEASRVANTLSCENLLQLLNG